MSYIDGFVIAVPTANRQQFIEHARHFDAMFIELGALRVIESWGDDVPDGKVTDFRRAVVASELLASNRPRLCRLAVKSSMRW